MDEITAIELQQPNPPPAPYAESVAYDSAQEPVESPESEVLASPEAPLPDDSGMIIDFFA